jgi:ribosomal-protein-serine acetyltransferase
MRLRQIFTTDLCPGSTTLTQNNVQATKARCRLFAQSTPNATKMLKPPHQIEIEAGLLLRTSRLSDAAAHWALLEANRDYLKPWMPWAHFITEPKQYETFIRNLHKNRRLDLEYGYQIMLHGRMVGRISIVRMDHQNRKCEIGYWVSAEHQGKGIVTKVTQAIIDQAFNVLDFERVEIRCAIKNERSAAVPKRLGFQLEGVLRHAEKSEAGYRDLQLWAQTKTQ